MRNLIAAAALVLLIAAAACGGGGDKKEAPAGISDAQLQAMVLPQEELGEAYASLDFDQEGSGFESNADAIAQALDQEDESQDVEEFRRVNGYTASYSSLNALVEGEGVFTLETSVILYEDSDGASDNMRDAPQDLQRQVGKEQDGVTPENAETFDPGEIGDESLGQTVSAKVKDQEDVVMRGVSIAFRVGRLLGIATVVRTDDQDGRDEVKALALKLEERMRKVLNGEIQLEGTPTAAAHLEQPASEKATATGTAAAVDEQPPSVGDTVSPTDILSSFRYKYEIEVSVGGESAFQVTSEGEFQAPDRLRAENSGSVGELALSGEKLVIIGEDAWLDTGDGYGARSTSDADVESALALSPAWPEFWTGFDLAGDLRSLKGESDEKNGVAALKYPLADLIGSLAAIGFLPSGLEGVTFDAFDVWLAEDGAWLVSLNAEFSAASEAFADAFGFPVGEGEEEASMAMRIDITDANSDDISILAPEEKSG
jgi:hypothetical protein